MAELPTLFPKDTPIPEGRDFDALPAGEYAVIIEASETKQTSKGGTMLVLTLQVIEGKFKGRKLWDRLNIINDNVTAQEIARATLAVICKAHGIDPRTLTDSRVLHNKPLAVKVKQYEYEGETKNEVKGYRAVKEGAKLAVPKAEPAGGGYGPTDDIPFAPDPS